MRAVATAFVIALAACGARTELYAPEEEDASVLDAAHDAPHDARDEDAIVDAGIEDAPLPSPLCATFDGAAPTKICTDDVHVGFIDVSMSTCFVDLVIQFGQDGFVNFACDGQSQWANAKFPDGGFVGTIEGSTVDLCTGTVFPWSDGCTWASAQRITGDLDSGTLQFTYEETPIEGGPCETPCSAQGTILVE